MTRVGNALGEWGEALAESKLRALGMQILDRRWRTREGELDLVARDGRTIVFVEVKTRRSTAFGAPAESVTARKQQRIHQLAAAWLAAHNEHARDIRFDVVSVLRLDDGGPAVDHIPAAF